MRSVFLLLCLSFSFLVTAEAFPEGFPPPPLATLKEDAPCLGCGGMGLRQIKDKGIQSNTAIPYANRSESAKLAPSKPLDAKVLCNTCDGKGHFVREVTVAERLAIQLKRRQIFDRECLQQQCVPIGAAYMKRDIAEALSPEAYAEYALRFPKRCEECLGLKLEACSKCDSTGKVTQTRREKNGQRTETLDVCPRCYGSGGLTCKRCKGEGLAKHCKRCSGTGITKKRARKNSTEALERCRSCDGNGRR